MTIYGTNLLVVRRVESSSRFKESEWRVIMEWSWYVTACRNAANMTKIEAESRENALSARKS